jgi:hypothetical protein
MQLLSNKNQNVNRHKALESGQPRRQVEDSGKHYQKVGEYAPIFFLASGIQHVQQCNLVVNHALFSVGVCSQLFALRCLSFFDRLVGNQTFNGRVVLVHKV